MRSDVQGYQEQSRRTDQCPQVYFNMLTRTSNILKWESLPIRSFWIEKICDRNEAGAYHGPDDPEFPTNILNPWESHLYDSVVT